MEMRTLAALLLAALLLSFGCVQGILQAPPKAPQAGKAPPNPNNGAMPSNYTESEDMPPPPPPG